MKRNQIMITTLAVMIAIAGYLTFAGRQMEETVVVADEVMVNDDMTAMLDLSEEDIVSDLTEEGRIESGMEEEGEYTENYIEETMSTEVEDTEIVVDMSGNQEEMEEKAVEGEVMEGTPGEAVFTSSKAISTLSAAKLLKEQTRAKNKEMLSEIVSNEVLDAAQKEDALAQMVALTEKSEKEMETEILLSSKGFTESVVSIGKETVDVVVYAETLSDAQLAQIMDIVTRKTEIGAENIIISQVKQK